MGKHRKRSKPKLTSAQMIQPGAQITLTCRSCGQDYEFALPGLCPHCGEEYRPQRKPKDLGVSVVDRIDTGEKLS